MTPVVDMIFSRWTAPILWSLHHDGPLRFSEIRERLGPVTPKVLTQRLRQLERDGMITREQFPEVPPRVEYTITELGLSLGPAFQALAPGPTRTCHGSQSPAITTTRPDAPARPEHFPVTPRRPGAQLVRRPEGGRAPGRAVVRSLTATPTPIQC